MEQSEWEKLSLKAKRRELYLRQKKLLDDFLERGAISLAQYDKSFGDLTEKMGMQETGAQADIHRQEDRT